MSPMIADAVGKVFLVVTSSVCAGSAVVCGGALWGGKKVLEQNYKPDRSEREDLTPSQKTGLKVAGYSLIALGVAAGVVACTLTSMVLVPTAVTALGLLAGAATIPNFVIAISSVASNALTLTGLYYGTKNALLMDR